MRKQNRQAGAELFEAQLTVSFPLADGQLSCSAQLWDQVLVEIAKSKILCKLSTISTFPLWMNGWIIPWDNFGDPPPFSLVYKVTAFLNSRYFIESL